MKTDIIQTGDPTLRMRAVAIPQKDFGTPKLRRIVKEMSDALSGTKHGVALAAPQIGHSLRIFVVAGKILAREVGLSEEEADAADDLVFINPEIIKVSRKKESMHEGCLSVDGLYGFVKRHAKASVRAYDIAGKPFTYNGSGLMSQIFQHETDHLDGILFVDKAESFEEPERRNAA